MKSAVVCAILTVLFVASGFSADERTLPSSPTVTAKASAENHDQPPASAVAPANVPAVPANTASLTPAAMPNAPSAIVLVKRRTEAHRFLDIKNSLALSAVAGSLIADTLSTQKGMSYPGFYEINPIARPFVQTRAGASVYAAGSLGLVAAGMYVAHRTNHHKLERIVPFAIAGWEGLLSVRNYHVIALNTK